MITQNRIILSVLLKILGGNLLYDAESSNLVLHDYLEGWDMVGGRFKKELMYSKTRYSTKYCKVINLQLK